MQLFLFFALAIVAIAAAVGVLVSKNAVYSALALLVNFAVLAVMYVMLHAQFVAVVQVIVYAGAIVVLFLFVIMLIGTETRLLGTRGRSRQIATIIAVVAGVAFLASVVYVSMAGTLASDQGRVPGNGAVQAIGEALFTQYLLPFELASVLLLVAMIGAVVLARKPKSDEA